MGNDIYSGLKLTPNVFQQILLIVFDGKQIERQEAIQQVKAYFSEHGGYLENKSYIQTFKAAAKGLKPNGMINIGYGMWRINYKEQTVEIVPTQQSVAPTYTADKEIGVGDSAVYVYYYSAYCELAKLKNINIWECKIGRTDRDPLERIFSQAGTCYPEVPHLALIIRCPNSAQLESALHEILRFKNRWLKDAPGDEWFLTSPKEVENIYTSILAESPNL